MKLKKVDWFTADTLHYSINFDRRAAAYLNKALHSDRTQTVDGQSGSLLNRYWRNGGRHLVDAPKLPVKSVASEASIRFLMTRHGTM